jgi:dihydroflavonol-4-reductase
VLTSSAAAITDQADGHVNTEEDWNTRSTLTRNPYYYSKVLAELAAWAFVESQNPGFDLVTINPFLVVGPSLVPGINPSASSLVGLTNRGTPAILSLEWPFADVRDVSRAHMLAMETPLAKGRYLVAAETRTVRQVVDLLEAHGWAERYRLPTLGLDNRFGVALTRLSANFQSSGTGSYLRTHVGGSMRFDNSKVKRDLGLVFRDVDQTILDTMEDLDRWGYLGKKR